MNSKLVEPYMSVRLVRCTKMRKCVRWRVFMNIGSVEWWIFHIWPQETPTNKIHKNKRKLTNCAYICCYSVCHYQKTTFIFVFIRLRLSAVSLYWEITQTNESKFSFAQWQLVIVENSFLRFDFNKQKYVPKWALGHRTLSISNRLYIAHVLHKFMHICD